MIVGTVTGYRPFWLALEATIARVRHMPTGRTLARYDLDEGDGLVLTHSCTRVDWEGRLVPIGTRQQLEDRSAEIRTLRSRVVSSDVCTAGGIQ